MSLREHGVKLLKCSVELPNNAVSDTTDDAQGTAAGNKKLLFIIFLGFVYEVI